MAVANLILAVLHGTIPNSRPPVIACHADNSASSALLEMWAALLTGGSLVLVSMAGASIGPLIRSSGVTVALLTGDEVEGILEVGLSCKAPFQAIISNGAWHTSQTDPAHYQIFFGGGMRGH